MRIWEHESMGVWEYGSVAFGVKPYALCLAPYAFCFKPYAYKSL